MVSIRRAAFIFQEGFFPGTHFKLVQPGSSGHVIFVSSHTVVLNSRLSDAWRQTVVLGDLASGIPAIFSFIYLFVSVPLCLCVCVDVYVYVSMCV